jgi:hypothetical protein
LTHKPIQDGAIRNLKTLPLSSLWIWLLGKAMHPQERGAFTSVFAACAPRDNPHISHGAYIVPPNVADNQSKVALDNTKQSELFEFTMKTLEEIGVKVQGVKP